MYVLFTNFNLRSPITFCVTLSTPLCTIVYVAHVDVDEIIIQFNSIQSHMDEGKWTSDKSNAPVYARRVFMVCDSPCDLHYSAAIRHVWYFYMILYTI